MLAFVTIKTSGASRIWGMEKKMNAEKFTNEPSKEIFRVEYVYGNRGREATWTDITREEALRDAQSIADVLNWSVELFARPADIADSVFEKIAVFTRPIKTPTDPIELNKFLAKKLVALANLISRKIFFHARWKDKI